MTYQRHLCACGCGEITRGIYKNHHKKRHIAGGEVYRNSCSRPHILIAEAALGKKLPKGALVHHVDENRSNNEHSNLVVCENRGYHALLHRRKKAYEACGHANWRKCMYCQQYDSPDNMVEKNCYAWHRFCYNRYHQNLKGKLSQRSLKRY